MPVAVCPKSLLLTPVTVMILRAAVSWTWAVTLCPLVVGLNPVTTILVAGPLGVSTSILDVFLVVIDIGIAPLPLVTLGVASLIFLLSILVLLANLVTYRLAAPVVVVDVVGVVGVVGVVVGVVVARVSVVALIRVVMLFVFSVTAP